MEKLNHIIIAESVAYSTESSISLINTFNLVNATSYPAIQEKMVIAVNFELKNTTDEHSGKIQIKNKEDNILIAESSFSNVCTQDAIGKEVNIVADFSNTLFQKKGEYYISFYIDSDEEQGRRKFYAM